MIINKSSYIQYKCNLQRIAIGIIALNSLSFISLIAVLGVYIANWTAISSFPMRLSFYLCLSCLGQSLTIIILNPITLHQMDLNNQQQGIQTTSYCIFDAFLKVTFDLSSILWTSLIILAVYCSITTKVKLQKLEVLFIIVGYIVPLLSACVPIFFNLYQFDTYDCWFEQSYSGKGLMLRLGYYFIPLWTLFIANMTLSILTYRNLKNLQLPEQILHSFKKIVLFPLILFATGIFGTIDLFYNYIYKQQIVWLNNLSLLIISLYGFLNALAYGFNPLIRERMKFCFKKEQYRLSNVSYSSNQQKSQRDSEQIKAQLFQMSTVRKNSQMTFVSKQAR